MLFSRDDVSTFVNANFEPVWVSVRPVPIVKIDFGNGQVVTRTLHGNILTSVCSADGLLLDSLPGIYTPEAYLDQLDQLRLLASAYGKLPAKTSAAWLALHHTRAAKALQANQPPARLAGPVVARKPPAAAQPRLDLGKGRIEIPMKAILARGVVPVVPPNFLPPNRVPPVVAAAQEAAQPAPPPVAGWKELLQDTQVNESQRRLQIHQMLARSGPVRPDKVLKPIYKDVLHADLDDPYLGLGKTLFENYPFANEDAARETR